ncbi:MAG TPA: HAD family hydrolase [Gammaproteobacteria bacterium]|jgi:hypothetical protein
MNLRVAMWSGPRNISTTMMRSWENREDAVVVDEPLYAHYLIATGVDHPGREEVIASQPNDWRRVAKQLTGALPEGKPIWYQKHMTQHVLADMDLDWLDGLSNCFLIRRPELVVASFTKVRPDAALWELGFVQQTRIFEHVSQKLGIAPPVLDAEDVLRGPKAMLAGLCERLGVPFSERMLHWPAGPRSSDGVWAPHWYAAVERSTGFEPYEPRTPELSGFQQGLAELCRPHYDALAKYRLRPA